MARDVITRAISNAAYEIRKKSGRGYKFHVPDNYKDLIDFHELNASISAGRTPKEAAKEQIYRFSQLEILPNKDRHKSVWMTGVEGKQFLSEVEKWNRNMNLLRSIAKRRNTEVSEDLIYNVDISKINNPEGVKALVSSTTPQSYLKHRGNIAINNIEKSLESAQVPVDITNRILKEFKKLSAFDIADTLRRIGNIVEIYGSDEQVAKNNIEEWIENLEIKLTDSEEASLEQFLQKVRYKSES